MCKEESIRRLASSFPEIPPQMFPTLLYRYGDEGYIEKLLVELGWTKRGIPKILTRHIFSHTAQVSLLVKKGGPGVYAISCQRDPLCHYLTFNNNGALTTHELGHSPTISPTLTTPLNLLTQLTPKPTKRIRKKLGDLRHQSTDNMRSLLNKRTSKMSVVFEHESSLEVDTNSL